MGYIRSRCISLVHINEIRRGEYTIMKNYYEILGVSENVSKDVLDAVYKKLMENADNMSEENVLEIEEAYYVLSEKYSSASHTNDKENRAYVSNVKILNNKQETPKQKKNAKWIFLFVLISVLIWGINNFMSGGGVSKNSIWGTFESKEGELISIELKEDWEDDLYTGYLASTETPWLKEYVMINLDSKTIKYPVTMDSLTFELNNKKLTLQGKTYTKISDECLYEKILTKEKMSLDNIIGTYKNASSYYVVVEKTESEETVNVFVCDNFAQILGSVYDVPFDEFYMNAAISITIEDEEYDVYFEQEELIVCDAFMDGFIKQKDLSPTNTSNPNKMIDVNTKELLSLDVIEEYTENLLVNGAYKVKEFVGNGLSSIDDFYVEFTVSPKSKNLEDIDILLTYQYEVYEYETGMGNYQYGNIGFRSTLVGDDLQRVQSESEVDEALSEYWEIVQGHKEGYQRLNENRNDCWYFENENGETNYVYANWDMPEIFSKIVAFDKQAYIAEIEDDNS